jgi:hypothetical protein
VLYDLADVEAWLASKPRRRSTADLATHAAMSEKDPSRAA